MWKSVMQMIQSMDEERYVFLRNTENISDDFSEEDDLDILCYDIKKIVECVHAIPLNNRDRCYNYYTVINNRKLFLDIRCVGDGYFDRMWEIEMIDTRKRKGLLYVLNDENQKYSVLYHCLFQKDNLSAKKYSNYIEKVFGSYDINQNIIQLSEFMKEKKYCFEMPDDKGVYLNNENIKSLKEIL